MYRRDPEALEIASQKYQAAELADETPIIQFGGVLTVKQLLPLYARLLSSGAEGSLPNKERFLPIPKSHLGEPEEMFERFNERFLKIYEKINQRVVVAGHSLGGLAATMVGLEHPEKVESVVCLAGAQDGIRQETPSTRVLRKWINMPGVDSHINHDSDFMNEHRERIATEWPEEVSLHLISPTVDDLIVVPQGLGLELPEGQEPHRRIIVPGIPGIGSMMRRLPGMPKDVEFLPGRLTTHYDIPLSSAVLRYVRGVRQGVEQIPALPDASGAELPSLPQPMPVVLPETGLAAA